MKYFLVFAAFVSVVLLATPGCYYDNLQELHPELALPQDCDTTGTISFSAQVQSVMSGSCGSGNSCHNANSTSGIDLSTYDGVKSVGQSGQLWSSINWDGFASNMPKGSSSQIKPCYQAIVKKWIDEGMPNN